MNAAPPPRITVSIVSHGHGDMLHDLLGDLDARCRGQVEVLLTHNVPESADFDIGRYGIAVRQILNTQPRGYGANHNAAFAAGSREFFCALNPDIRLPQNPYPALLQALGDSGAGVIAPRIVNALGAREDSARKFPTPMSILAKALTGKRPQDYEDGTAVYFPDWIAGMFMLFRREAYERVGGFDERYFLYYEDVDICARLGSDNIKVAVCPSASAIHDARRASHRNLRHLGWHLSSMARFFARRAPPVAARIR